MKFGISQYSNLTKEQNSWINGFSNELELFFENKDYGVDLKELYVGLITVKPDFEQFFKKRRPRYRPGEKTSVVDGITITTINCAEIDIKINYTEIHDLEKEEIIDLVSESILNEIDGLTRLSKLKQFDYLTFKSDLEKYLKRKNK
jgi:hypothetical protein